MSQSPIQSTLESDVCRLIFGGFTTSTVSSGYFQKEFQVRLSSFSLFNLQGTKILLQPSLSRVLIYFTRLSFVCQALFQLFPKFFVL